MAAHATHRPARGLRAHCGSWSAESSDPGAARKSTPRRPCGSDQTVTHHKDACSSRNAARSGGRHSSVHNDRHGCMRGGGDLHQSTADCILPLTMPHAICPVVAHSESPSTCHGWRAVEVTVSCCIPPGLHEHSWSGVMTNLIVSTADHHIHCLTCRPTNCLLAHRIYRHGYSQICSLHMRHASNLSISLLRCTAYRQASRMIATVMHSGRINRGSHCSIDRGRYGSRSAGHGASASVNQCTVRR